MTNLHYYTQETIGWIAIIFGSLSLISTLIVISLYILNKKMRDFAFRLVFYLQISDFLLSLSMIMLGSQNFSKEFNYKFCQAQAFLINFGVLGTSIWTFIITLIMLQTRNIHIDSLKKYEKYYVSCGYLIPLLLTIV